MVDGDEERVSSSAGTLPVGHESAPPTLPGIDVDIEKTASGDNRITLPEDAAFEHSRTFPEDRTQLRLCFSANDPDNPRNWSRAKKWYITLFVCWMNFLYSINISDLSLGFQQIAQEFNVSMDVATLAGLTMVSVGGAIGTLFW